VARHIFKPCPMWIYTQSNITSIIFTWVHYTNRKKIKLFCYRNSYKNLGLDLRILIGIFPIKFL
jgi:hypothetical protein